MNEISPVNDVALVRQFLETGSEQAFRDLYRAHSRPLYGTALRMLRRREEAEDAVQDTFVSYYRKLPDIDSGRVGAWLHRVLVNHCIDRVRRARRWLESEVDQTAHVGAPPASGAGVDLDRAVAGLPERARVVFVLHDVEGFKHREIADMLDVNEGTAKSQLFRARQLLRAMLGKGEA